jgi:ribosomal protein L44E
LLMYPSPGGVPSYSEAIAAHIEWKQRKRGREAGRQGGRETERTPAVSKWFVLKVECQVCKFARVISFGEARYMQSVALRWCGPHAWDHFHIHHLSPLSAYPRASE